MRSVLVMACLACAVSIGARAQTASGDDGDLLQGTPPPAYPAPPDYPGYQPAYPPSYPPPYYPPPYPPPGYQGAPYPGYAGPPPGYDPRYADPRRPDRERRSDADRRGAAQLQAQRNRSVITAQQQFSQGRITREQLDAAISQADRQLNDALAQGRR